MGVIKFLWYGLRPIKKSTRICFTCGDTRVTRFRYQAVGWAHDSRRGVRYCPKHGPDWMNKHGKN